MGSPATTQIEALLPKPHDNREFRTYLNELAQRLGDVQIVSYDTLQDVKRLAIDLLYVPQRIAPRHTSADSDVKDWPPGELLFDALNAHKRVVVLGDPGGGKTTLLNWMGWRLSVGSSHALPGVLDWLLPIPLILRELSLGQGDSFDALLDCFMRHPLAAPLASSTALRDYWARGQVLLLIDGLDEIGVTDRQRLRSMLLDGFVRGVESHALVTSRMVGYEDCPLHEVSFAKETPEHGAPRRKDQPIRSMLPGLSYLDLLQQRERGQYPHDTVRWGEQRWLMPFRDEQIQDFALRWYGLRLRSGKEAMERAAQLFGQIKSRADTLRLARTPHLLTMMAIVVDNRLQLPDGRALLYKEIASAYLGAADKTRNIPVIEVPWMEKQRWLGYVAYRMQVERHSTHDKDEDAGLLASESKVLAWLGEAMRASSYGQGEELPKQFLGWVARRSGLLLPRGMRLSADSPDGGEVEHYGFVHLSFQEYFCAAYLLTVVTGPKFASSDRASNATKGLPVTPKLKSLQEAAKSDVWAETLVFLFELCANERGVDWVDEISRLIFAANKGENSNALHLLARLAMNRHAGFTPEAQNGVTDRVVQYCAKTSAGQVFPGTHTKAVLPLLSSEVQWAKLASGLDGLYNLQLRLNDAEIKDISALADLRSLQVLSLSNTGVTDVSALAGLKALQRLYLDNTGVTGVSALAGLKSLEVLSLNHTGVTDVSALAGLKALQSLSLSNTGVTDVSALAGLKALQRLYLDNTGVTDVSALAGLKALQRLYLDNTGVTGVSALAGLKALQVLSLNHTGVTDVSALAGLKALQRLYLDNTGVTDVSALAGLKSLEVLSLNHTGVTDVSALAGLKALQSLSLSHTGVTGVSALAGLKSLEALSLNHTGVTDVSALAGLKALQWLFLNGTGVTDVSAFKAIKNLSIIR